MSTSIAEKTLWDMSGNRCRVEMFQIAPGTFEVYFHDFNSAIPTRFVGKLGLCNNKVDHWLYAKKQAGFIEQLPSYNPEAWIP